MFDASPCGFNRFQPKGSLGWQWSSKWWWSLQVLRPGPRNTGMLGRAPWGQCAGKYLVSIPPKCWPANNRNDEYQPWNFGGTDTLFQTNPSMNGLMSFVFSLLQSVWTPNIWMCQSQQCFFGGEWESSYREAVALAARRVEAHRARLLTFRADLRFVWFGFCPNMGCSWVLLAAPKSHWSLSYFRIDIAIPLSRGQMSAQEKVTPHISTFWFPCHQFRSKCVPKTWMVQYQKEK